MISFFKNNSSIKLIPLKHGFHLALTSRYSFDVEVTAKHQKNTGQLASKFSYSSSPALAKKSSTS